MQARSASVVLPTHNPDAGRLQRTIEALRQQTLPLHEWELVVVDNASAPSSAVFRLDLSWHPHARCVSEPTLGLTRARRTGFGATTGGVIILVDDDNVLDPHYLTHATRLLAEHPRLGAAGGRSIGEFETAPPTWITEFLDLLAVRDLGDKPVLADSSTTDAYPEHAPIGAGMVLRRDAVNAWLGTSPDLLPSDRRGRSLSSGGDNDIVLTILRHGWQVAYDPRLVLHHLIPENRLQPRYLARLNFGIQRSWIGVLDRHGVRPWTPIPWWTLHLRCFRAYWRRRTWRGPAEFIRWRGDCGRFRGRAELKTRGAQS